MNGQNVRVAAGTGRKNIQQGTLSGKVIANQARANSAFIRATWKLARLYQFDKCLEEEGIPTASEIKKITLK